MTQFDEKPLDYIQQALIMTAADAKKLMLDFRSTKAKEALEDVSKRIYNAAAIGHDHVVCNIESKFGIADRVMKILGDRGFAFEKVGSGQYLEEYHIYWAQAVGDPVLDTVPTDYADSFGGDFLQRKSLTVKQVRHWDEEEGVFFDDVE